MPKANYIQTNFTSGELSPQLHGRIDLQRYQNGVAQMENFIVRPHGGAIFRHGTKYISTTKNSGAGKSLLQEFTFAADDTYLLEFYEGGLRIFQYGQPVLDESNEPIEIPHNYLENELSELQFCQSADVLFIVHPKHHPAILVRESNTNWILEDFETEDGPYMDENTSDITLWVTDIVSRATLTDPDATFTSADENKFVEFIDEDGFLMIGRIDQVESDPTTVIIEPKSNVVDYKSIDPNAVIGYRAANGTPTQSDKERLMFPIGVGMGHAKDFGNRLRSTLTIWGAESEHSYIKIRDTWYETGYHYATQEEIRTESGENQFSQNYAVDVLEVVSIPEMVPTTNPTISNKSITAKLNASDDIFDETRDVGRHFRLNLRDQQVWGKITEVISPTQCNVELGRDVPIDPKEPNKLIAQGKTNKWRFGAWFTDNYPSSIIIHEQRLTFAGTLAQPQTVWMSRSGIYNNFAPTDNDSTVSDDHGITFTLGSRQINRIAWLESGPVMLIGTIASEWQVKASTLGQPLTPTNLSVIQQTSYGSVPNLVPHRIGSAVMFCHRSGNKIREMIYNFQIDAFEARDITVVSEHILRKHGGAARTTYQMDPNSIIWVLRNDGTLAGCTYERDQDVISWHNHDVNGFVEDIVAIPAKNNRYMELYMIVRRTINGADVRYIEMLDDNFEPENPQDKSDMIYLDCSKTFSGDPRSSLDGLEHLEGETISIVADGSVHPPRKVTSGAVELDYEASVIHAGLPYSGKLKILPVEGGSMFGTSQGVTKRIHRINLRLLNSIGFKVGKDESSLTEVSFRSSDSFMDSSPDLFSGDKEIHSDLSYDTLGQYMIVQDQPYPLNIMSIMTFFKTNG